MCQSLDLFKVYRKLPPYNYLSVSAPSSPLGPSTLLAGPADVLPNIRRNFPCCNCYSVVCEQVSAVLGSIIHDVGGFVLGLKRRV